MRWGELRVRVGGLSMALLLLSGGVAHASEAEPAAKKESAEGELEGPKSNRGAPAPKVKYREKTQVDFNESQIDGSLTTPDGDYLRSTKRAEFENLIRLRSDFFDELEQSSQDL